MVDIAHVSCYNLRVRQVIASAEDLSGNGTVARAGDIRQSGKPVRGQTEELNIKKHYVTVQIMLRPFPCAFKSINNGGTSYVV